MGLLSVIQWFNGTEYTCELPAHILAKFTSTEIVDPRFVVGFDASKKNKLVSFCGKCYVKAIMNITGYSLRHDLDSHDLKIICQKLEELLDNTEDRDKLDQAFYIFETGECEVQDWIEKMTQAGHVPSPREIAGLLQIFRICHENNLQVHAS